MTYEQCINYLYQQLPMYQRIGNAAFKKSLNNIIALTEALGSPHKEFRSVHVAGTNGKGSSAHMLAAVLQSAGYKTGLYTSPHLKDFTERIRVNGHPIAKQNVIEFVEQHKGLFEEINPSFFEMTVALAFQHFAEERVDIAIIEVGLGGRLDSTNIITPLVSLITNISFDHQSMLGNTLVEIAGEKAGIIKPHVPAVISVTQPEIEEVFIEKSRLEAAPLYFADQIYSVDRVSATSNHQLINVAKNEHPYLMHLELDLTGAYQEYNLPGILKTIDCLNLESFEISNEQIREGLMQVKHLTGLKGRWQQLNEKPLTICDTGHNIAGIKQVVAQLEALEAPKVHFVFGAVNDKDISDILELLPVNYRYYFCQADIPRALPVEELFEKAKNVGLKGEKFLTVAAAIKAAKVNAAENEVVFIGGSTFVVAEIEEL